MKNDQNFISRHVYSTRTFVIPVTLFSILYNVPKFFELTTRDTIVTANSTGCLKNFPINTTLTSLNVSLTNFYFFLNSNESQTLSIIIFFEILRFQIIFYFIMTRWSFAWNIFIQECTIQLILCVCASLATLRVILLLGVFGLSPAFWPKWIWLSFSFGHLALSFVAERSFYYKIDTPIAEPNIEKNYRGW